MFPNFHFSIERWRKNEEYGVWVSTHGRVRLIQNKEYLNIRINKDGYCVVFTNKGPQFVHRLVAYTWLGGKRNEKYNIDHINSNKRDNSIKNLRWIEINLNTDYAIYTRTDREINEEKEKKVTDSIESVEKTEKEEQLHQKLKDIKTISCGNGKAARIALTNLFEQGKIVLVANKIKIHTYDELFNYLGYKDKQTDDQKKVLYGCIVHAIRAKENFNKSKWSYEVVNGQQI